MNSLTNDKSKVLHIIRFYVCDYIVDPTEMMCFFNFFDFFQRFQNFASAPISASKRTYAVACFNNLPLYFVLVSEVWVIFFVRGELKKLHWLSKPLHPADKKFSASVYGGNSNFPAAPSSIFLELQIHHSLNAPDAQEV